MFHFRHSSSTHRNDLVLVDHNRVKGEPLAIGQVKEVLGKEVRVIWWQRVAQDERGYKDSVSYGLP